MFRLNPEDFLLQASRLINREKAAAVVRHITYHRLDASYDAALFTNAVRRGRLGCTAVPAAHSISDYVICDTDRERAFAEALEASEAVRLYVRLPKSFFIPTPVGRYTPTGPSPSGTAQGIPSISWQRPAARPHSPRAWRRRNSSAPAHTSPRSAAER